MRIKIHIFLLLFSIIGCHKKNKHAENFNISNKPKNQFITIEEKAFKSEILEEEAKFEEEEKPKNKDDKQNMPLSSGPILQSHPIPPPPEPEDDLLEDDFLENDSFEDDSLEDDSSDDEIIIKPTCGNGIVTAPEQCDDGNEINNDGCNNTCTLAKCGNCIVDYGEECDVCDPTVTGCTTKCLLQYCGNKRLDPGEQCDDGNNIAGDGCSPTCKYEFCCPVPTDL